MNQFFKRLTLPTPAFFKKVRNTGLTIVAIGTMLLTFGGQFPDINWVSFIVKYSKDFIAAGTLIAGVAQLTAVPEVPNKDL